MVLKAAGAKGRARDWVGLVEVDRVVNLGIELGEKGGALGFGEAIVVAVFVEGEAVDIGPRWEKRQTVVLRGREVAG